MKPATIGLLVFLVAMSSAALGYVADSLVPMLGYSLGIAFAAALSAQEYENETRIHRIEDHA